MFGHNYITSDVEAIPLTDFIEGKFESAARVSCDQQRTSVVATTSNEMKAPALLETSERPRHGCRIASMERVFESTFVYVKAPPCRKERDKDGAPRGGGSSVKCCQVGANRNRRRLIE